jgi:hypothetical protein
VPTKSRKENTFIERFLSAYEDFSWADARIDWLDERLDGAVEALATRKFDGKTLAIEHTIIEPFLGDKKDFARFENTFLGIEEDKSLAVPGRWIRVFVPVGTLLGQRNRATRDALVKAVHSWLKVNRTFLPDGFSEHRCAITEIPDKQTPAITLYIRVVPLPGSAKLHVRRQQTEDNLDQVIEKALKKKLPKLVHTNADRRILLLERQHMNLYPDRMLEEIEKRKNAFPELARVDEIWILETMFYEREGHLGFERFESGTLVGSLYFSGAELLDKFENGQVVLGPTSSLSRV